MNGQTTVLQVGGLHWATSGAVVERTLRRRPGVLAVSANTVSQTASVTYDADVAEDVRGPATPWLPPAKASRPAVVGGTARMFMPPLSLPFTVRRFKK